jgi:hypothetical protein
MTTAKGGGFPSLIKELIDRASSRENTKKSITLQDSSIPFPLLRPAQYSLFRSQEAANESY